MRRLSSFLVALSLLAFAAQADDLDDIQASGILRHLGVPYANFVTGSGDGLDVELLQGFASHLGVAYVFVATDWSRMIGDLTGRHARHKDGAAELLAATPIRGDVVANGVTILGWRAQVIEFAEPTFPTGVWLVALADSPLKPIRPAGSLERDIVQAKTLLGGVSVLAVPNSCLDPALYQLDRTGADIRLFPTDRNLIELIPALMKGDAMTPLLDVPDALVALDRWPGQIKVLGPLSEQQVMAPAFRKNSARLRAAFNAYVAALRADGRYAALVQKYYPAVTRFYPSFFSAKS